MQKKNIVQNDTNVMQAQSKSKDSLVEDQKNKEIKKPNTKSLN